MISNTEEHTRIVYFKWNVPQVCDTFCQCSLKDWFSIQANCPNTLLRQKILVLPGLHWKLPYCLDSNRFIKQELMSPDYRTLSYFYWAWNICFPKLHSLQFECFKKSSYDYIWEHMIPLAKRKLFWIAIMEYSIWTEAE